MLSYLTGCVFFLHCIPFLFFSLFSVISVFVRFLFNTYRHIALLPKVSVVVFPSIYVCVVGRIDPMLTMAGLKSEAWRHFLRGQSMIRPWTFPESHGKRIYYKLTRMHSRYTVFRKPTVLGADLPTRYCFMREIPIHFLGYVWRRQGYICWW